MNVGKDTVVQLYYSLFDADNSLIEKTEEGNPIAYLHGHANMIAGFEKAMEGKAVGEHVSITLSPDEAYGQRREDAIARVPVKHLQGAKVWKKGMNAIVHTEQGARQVTVVKVGLKMVDVDTNHPMAGKTIRFEVDIADIRAATAEEIAHGHAHGAGGHHH